MGSEQYAGKRPKATKLNLHYRLKDIYVTIIWIVTTYAKYVFVRFFQKLTKVIRANENRSSSIDVDRIAKSLRTKPAGLAIKVDRSSRAQSSNSMRPMEISGRRRHFIPLGAANKVLHIDTSTCEVTVEPGVTMEQLVDALLPHMLVPFVVPEFKALTVGGVLAGAGLESSSWVHGQFGDHLLSAQYMLADGTLVTCSPDEHSDLFFGALGACGTLGLLVQATIRVQRIYTHFMQIQYHELPARDSVIALMARMKTIKNTGLDELLDAVVYEDLAVIVTARYNHSGPATQSFSNGRDPWFYQYLFQNDKTAEVLHIKDYIFRYDSAAFWMSQYAISPMSDFLTFFQSFLPPITDLYVSKLLSWIPFGGYNKYSRWLLSPLLKTAPMYERLHHAPIDILADTLVIQDVYIPVENAQEFLIWLRKTIGGEKLWLCPIKKTATSQILSPHYSDTGDQKPRDGFINFGVWLHKISWQPGTPFATEMTKHIEDKVAALGGRKMLYSLSHYTPQEWNKIYNMEHYEALKQRWDPSYAWGDIYSKVGKAIV